MKYSARISAVCQRLQNGGGSATLRSISSHDGHVILGELIDVHWGWQIDPTNPSFQIEKPAPAESASPFGMTMTKSKEFRIFVFEGMTEDEALSQLIAAFQQKKAPKLTAIKNQLMSIKSTIESLRRSGVDLGVDVYSILEDDFDMDAVPCLIADKAENVRAFFDRHPADERRRMAERLLIEEVQES
jgi:hypothetical protein